MGYDIYIGQGHGKAKMVNGVMDVSKMKVREAFGLPDAPVFENDQLTKNENHRHPSYTVWHEMTKQTGIEDLFFNKKTGLMREHPGTQLLTFEHRNQIRQAKERWLEKYPDAVPGFEPMVFETKPKEEDIFNPGWTLARITWLDFWVNWAVENCEFPVIYNF
jgi:hypothetical protein